MSYQIQSLINIKDLNEVCRRSDLNNRQFLLGKNNSTASLESHATSITLTANAATTVLTFADGCLSATSILSLFPTTANAAAAIATTYESARNVLLNTLTLTHANNAQVDKTFRYSLNG